MSVAPSNSSSKAASYWQQTTQNRMLMVVLAMVVLVPILASPTNAQMHGFANYALRLMAGLLAGILVLRGRIATRRSEVATFLATGANLAVLLFLADAFVSVLLAPREIRFYSLTDSMRVVTGVLLYFALAYHVRRSEHLVKMLDALVLVSALMATLGLMSLASSSEDMRANLFGDHQLFGAFLMVLFPMTLIAAMTEREPKRLVTAQVAAALTGICILMTGTRTAWFGAMAELIALPLLSLIGSRHKQRLAEQKRQYIIPVLIVILCAVAFAAFGGFSGLIGNRLTSESRSSSMAYRARMWYAAEEMIKQKPLFGHGLASYAFLQNQYSQFGRPPEAVMKTGPSLSENAHSFWLQATAEQGLIGVCLFAAILLTFLMSGIRRLRFLEGGIRRSLLLASLTSVIGFIVDAIGNPAWQFAQVSMFLWLVLGLGVACMRPRTTRQDG